MQTITTVLTLITFVLYIIFRDFINSIVELPTFIMIAIFAELLVTPAIDFWTIRKRYEYIYVPVVIRSILLVVANAVLGVVAVLISDEKGYARILSCVFVNIIFGSVLYVYNIIKAKRIFYKPYAVFAIKFNIPLLLHYNRELLIDRREKSKSLAWSSVVLAFENSKRISEEVKKPKALGDIRGVSYIYPILWRFGLIRVPEAIEKKMGK